METIDGSFERDLIPVLQSLRVLTELRVGSRGGFPRKRVAKLRAALPGVTVIVVDTKADQGYQEVRW